MRPLSVQARGSFQEACAAWREVADESLDGWSETGLSWDNALVAGRGVSATHEALAAIRVMTISMAVGQAAGIAAAMAASTASPGGTASVRAVDTGALRAALREAGALLA